MKRELLKVLLLICIIINWQAPVNGQNITTVAGGATGHGGIWGIGGLATNAELTLFGGLAIDDWGNIYIGQSNEVLKVDANTGIISIVAGTGVAGYNGDGIPATNAELNNNGACVGGPPWKFLYWGWR